MLQRKQINIFIFKHNVHHLIRKLDNAILYWHWKNNYDIIILTVTSW